MELFNPQHEAFARHVALGLSLTEAAKRSGYSPVSAHNSGSRAAQKPQVAKRIEELRSSRSGVPSVGFQSPEGRAAALEDRWSRMCRIIVERAEDPELEEVPGGKTGLLIKQVKQIGTGDKAQVVTSYVLDRDLLAEMRAHETQVGEELGQRVTRRESYNQSTSLKLAGSPSEIGEALRQHLGNVPVGERRRLLAAQPELAELLQEPSNVTDKAVDNAGVDADS